MRALLPRTVAFAALGVAAAWAFAHAPVGSVIENVEMPVLGGGRHDLLSDAAANVFVFFKPGQEHSRATLKQVAVCAQEMAQKSVHWVAIVSSRFSPEEIAAEVKQSGIAMPVLIDADDALYGRLGVALTPVTGITDKNHRLVAYVPFTKVNYPVILRARLRHLLKEIDDEQLARALDPPQVARHGEAELARRRFKLAERQFQAGNLQKALESLAKSLESDPTLAAARALRGQILTAQGKRREALKEFEHTLKLDPRNVTALEGIKACRLEE